MIWRQLTYIWKVAGCHNQLENLTVSSLQIHALLLIFTWGWVEGACLDFQTSTCLVLWICLIKRLYLFTVTPLCPCGHCPVPATILPWSEWCPHRDSFCCSMRDPSLQHAVWWWCAGCPVVAPAQRPRGVWDLSLPTRDLTRVPCCGRWILNRWTTRDISPSYHSCFPPSLPRLDSSQSDILKMQVRPQHENALVSAS